MQTEEGTKQFIVLCYHTELHGCMDADHDTFSQHFQNLLVSSIQNHDGILGCAHNVSCR